MDYGNIKITQHALRVSVFKVWKLMDTIIMEEEEEDYGNIKITQHALRVSVFKVWKLMDTIIMEEEHYGNVRITQHAKKSVSLQIMETDGHYNYGKRRRWELYTLHKTSLFSCKILHRTFPNNGQMKIG